ncbi:MAG: tetratricopeptide repeat protein [Candidatus Omnitrophota bacterium]|nr:MAG: tetratricopeptide repeat protein [Candidatus Omnitrophota bacterium]
MKFGFKIIYFLLILSLTLPCYATDWKALHEKADSISSSQAIRLVNQNPGSLEDLYVLGLTYLNEHKDKSAMGVFQNILEQKTDFIGAKWGVAEVMQRMHHTKKSEKLLKEIIKKDPKFWPAYITLAFVQYMSMQFVPSLKSAYRVMKQKKDSVDLSNYVRAITLVAGAKGMIAHYGGPLAKMMHGLGVLPLLKKAERLQPNAIAVLMGIGSFYLIAPHIIGGDLDKAIEYLERAVSVDPLFPNAYVRLGQAYKMKGDLKTHEAFMAKVKQLDPQNELLKDITSGACKFLCVRSPDE